MKLLICIDDTDNADSKGTGAIADELKEIIKEQGFGNCGVTTRHQLLLHDDIPYTSHNSSMCFNCEIENDRLVRLPDVLYQYLKRESAPGSDPGIAIAELDIITQSELLIRFGLDAKRSILSKEMAYEIAEKTGVFLAEAGGDGMGVIGALAGVGLRLSGNDGAAKGGMKSFKQNQMYSVNEFISNSMIQSVRDTEGNALADDETVLVVWKAKPMLIGGSFVLTVKKSEQGIWMTMEKGETRDFGNRHAWEKACEQYKPDVEEEQVDAPLRSCLNCIFRRWTSKGYYCAVLQ